jgi:hypothetical protein
MSTAVASEIFVTSEKVAAASPRIKARAAGGLWLLCIAARVFAASAVLKGDAYM